MKDKIKRIRKEKKLSQGELAKLAGITRVSYTYFENGTTSKLSIDAAIGISKALGVPFNDLFEIENAKEQDLKNEITRLNIELENCKKELETIKIERDLNQDLMNQEIKSKLVFDQLTLDSVKKLNTTIAKLKIAESFNFLNNELFAAKFPDITGNRPLNKVFDFETVENFYYQFGVEIDEILNYIDLKKFRNDIRLNKLLSKFDLSINKSDLFNEIERFQASLRKELDL